MSMMERNISHFRKRDNRKIPPVVDKPPSFIAPEYDDPEYRMGQGCRWNAAAAHDE